MRMNRKKNLFLAAFLAWIIPGAGHYYLGRRGVGIIVFILISATFFYGMYLGELKNVYPERYTMSFLAQACTGTPAAVGVYLNYQTTGMVDESKPTFDVSFVYCGVAGLLNLLLIIDAAYVASGGKRGDDPV